MSDTSSFYRIDDPELLAKIDAFFEKVRQFNAQVKTLCETYGVEHYRSFNLIRTCIEFCCLLAEEDQKVDLSKFKVNKPKQGYKEIRPRKANKEFCAEFEALVPKSISYKDLTDLLVIEWHGKWGIPLMGYHHKAGKSFYFTFKGKPVPQAIEVVASEYHSKNQDDEEDE